MEAFDYQKNDSWGNVGWLGSDEYYRFWGKIYAHDLGQYFQNKIIIDVGAGNGLIWEKALDQGLVFKELHLIDPALNISEGLSTIPNVIEHPTSLQNLDCITADVAVFKQSMHHVYGELGVDMFNVIQAKTYVNFSMPPTPDWPMSHALMERYKPSCLDIREVIEGAQKDAIASSMISYPVKMERDVWYALLKKRFTSILHDCSDDFIEREIFWVKDNMPEQLCFPDTLECLIFK